MSNAHQVSQFDDLLLQQMGHIQYKNQTNCLLVWANFQTIKVYNYLKLWLSEKETRKSVLLYCSSFVAETWKKIYIFSALFYKECIKNLVLLRWH